MPVPFLWPCCPPRFLKSSSESSAVYGAPCSSVNGSLSLPHRLSPFPRWHRTIPSPSGGRLEPAPDSIRGPDSIRKAVNSPPRDTNPLTNPTHPFYSHPRVRWGLTPIRSPQLFLFIVTGTWTACLCDVPGSPILKKGPKPAAAEMSGNDRQNHFSRPHPCSLGVSAPTLPPVSPGHPSSLSPAHSSPAHSSPAHSSPAHSSPAHSSPAHSSPAHSSPAHSSPAHSRKMRLCSLAGSKLR